MTTIYTLVGKHEDGSRVKARSDDQRDIDNIQSRYEALGFTVEVTSKDVANPKVLRSLEYRGSDAEAELRFLRGGQS